MFISSQEDKHKREKLLELLLDLQNVMDRVRKGATLSLHQSQPLGGFATPAECCDCIQQTIDLLKVF